MMPAEISGSKRINFMAAVILNMFQFSSEIDVFLPLRNGFCNFLTDPTHAEQLRFIYGKDFGNFTEMFEQLPHAHRPDMLNHVQRDESFAGIHGGDETV